MGLFKNYVSQTRKPEGFLGKVMLKLLVIFPAVSAPAAYICTLF